MAHHSQVILVLEELPTDNAQIVVLDIVGLKLTGIVQIEVTL
jgi:hypothetical protein